MIIYTAKRRKLAEKIKQIHVITPWFNCLIYSLCVSFRVSFYKGKTQWLLTIWNLHYLSSKAWVDRILQLIHIFCDWCDLVKWLVTQTLLWFEPAHWLGYIHWHTKENYRKKRFLLNCFFMMNELSSQNCMTA